MMGSMASLCREFGISRKTGYKIVDRYADCGLAGQAVGVKDVDDGIWLVSFMAYDLGYIDLEEKTLQPLDNPFGPKVLPMCPEWTV
jgi:hypothetical protein